MEGGTLSCASALDFHVLYVQICLYVCCWQAECVPAFIAQPMITRSKEEAITLLRTHQEELASVQSEQLPSKFAKIASTESHCSSHSHGGDLGPFKRGQMQKPFEDTTFGLKVGQMSDIVETDSGVHLILRTA